MTSARHEILDMQNRSGGHAFVELDAGITNLVQSPDASLPDRRELRIDDR
jgi:hypothetical protein